MQKRILFALALLVVVAAAGALYWARSRTHASVPELRAMMRDEDAPRPVEPSIALRVNDDAEATVFPGTPIWFTVDVTDKAATNEIAAARVLAATVARLSRDPAPSRVPPGEIPRLKAAYERRRARATIALGADGHPWASAVQLVVRDDRGGEQPLAYALTTIDDGGTNAELDATNSVAASFGLASTDALAGTTSIVACLGATGSWKGRVCSEPVKLTVLARPSPLTAEQQQALERQSARFAWLMNDYQTVQNYGRSLVAADPHSIVGHIYLGEAKFGQQKWSDALEEFTIARSESIRQNPHAVERPRFLNMRVNQLIEKVFQSPP